MKNRGGLFALCCKMHKPARCSMSGACGWQSTTTLSLYMYALDNLWCVQPCWCNSHRSWSWVEAKTRNSIRFKNLLTLYILLLTTYYYNICLKDAIQPFFFCRSTKLRGSTFCVVFFDNVIHSIIMHNLFMSIFQKKTLWIMGLHFFPSRWQYW